MTAHVSEGRVPCQGCTACCEGITIFVNAAFGDDIESYETEVEGEGDHLALKHNADGSCIYLEAGKGCSIHERRPALCRAFDCRRFVKMHGDSAAPVILEAAKAAEERGRLKPSIPSRRRRRRRRAS